jgi:hypothetical protein
MSYLVSVAMLVTSYFFFLISSSSPPCPCIIKLGYSKMKDRERLGRWSKKYKILIRYKEEFQETYFVGHMRTEYRTWHMIGKHTLPLEPHPSPFVFILFLRWDLNYLCPGWP